LFVWHVCDAFAGEAFNNLHQALQFFLVHHSKSSVLTSTCQMQNHLQSSGYVEQA
jgi:hypothetical protein